MIEKYTYCGIEIYRSIYRFADSNMYAIVQDGRAVIFDPHKSDELTVILKDQNVAEVMVLLTHEHHDHTSGLYWYQDNFNTKFLVQKNGAEWMALKSYLRPMFLTFLLSEADKINGTDVLSEFKRDFVPKMYKADMEYDETFEWRWEKHIFSFYHIPGHSKGSSLIVLDNKIAFTGDTLFRNVPTTLRFPGGSKTDFIEKAIPVLKEKLRKEMIILPGHGKPFVLGEIMKKGHINVQFK